MSVDDVSEPEPDGLDRVRPMSDLDGLDEQTIKALTKLSQKLQPDRHKAFAQSLRHD